MSDLAEQIDALLALNAKGAVSHPIPGLAVELLTKAAEALRAATVPVPVTITDGPEEQRIEDLRFKAFRTNDPQDRQAYFDAASKWFQDRHYRYAALSQKPGEQG